MEEEAEGRNQRRMMERGEDGSHPKGGREVPVAWQELVERLGTRDNKL